LYLIGLSLMIIAMGRNLILTSLVLMCAITLAYSQKKERFKQESMPRDCEINLPLYYGSKKNKDLMEAVKKYKDYRLFLYQLKKDSHFIEFTF
jgi:hypothetical protein